MISVERLIRETADRFTGSDITYGHGTGNAIDEAAYLIFGYLNLDHSNPQLAYSKRISKSELEKLELLINRRIYENYPVAYLINQAWFTGLKFFVDDRVLVPRSPMGELISKRLQPWIGDRTLKRAMDMGTGSGCIAIALAANFPDMEIDAVDYSLDALDVARKNVQLHKMEKNINLIHSDFFKDIESNHFAEKYDLIISNPPYVDEEDIQEMAPEFHHEPLIGLASGKDGLESVKIILEEAYKYMTDLGLLIVEVGNSRNALERNFPHLPFIWIDFKCGGEGVFLLTKYDLENHNAENREL